MIDDAHGRDTEAGRKLKVGMEADFQPSPHRTGVSISHFVHIPLQTPLLPDETSVFRDYVNLKLSSNAYAYKRVRPPIGL